MMIKPGISELVKKVDSRYTLVTMAAKRVRMLGSDAELQLEEVKPISKAVEEIADGKVQYCREEDGYESTLIGEGGEPVFTPSEPSSVLDLEALRHELEIAEKRAAEERQERERLEREAANGESVQ